MDTIFLSQVDTVKIFHYDTIVKYDVPTELINNYMSILEKTNQQLGMWTNPYTISIMIIGILFTILTIIAAVLIWTQSSEFKKIISNTVNKYENDLSTLIQDKKQQLEEIEMQINEMIKDYEDRLENATLKQKDEIKIKLDELKERQQSIKKEIETPFKKTKGYDTIFNESNNFRLKVQCPICQKEFIDYDRVSFLKREGGSGFLTTCPYCNSHITMDY